MSRTEWPGDNVDHAEQLGDVMADVRVLKADRDRLKAVVAKLLEVLRDIVTADNAAIAEYRAMGLGEPNRETVALKERAEAAIKSAEASQ